jgi:uncharacterized UBP type Zn finger protein
MKKNEGLMALEMGDMIKCSQCKKHTNTYSMTAGICKECVEANNNYWEQFIEKKIIFFFPSEEE